MLKLTVWVPGTNPSTLEGGRALSRQFGLLKSDTIRTTLSATRQSRPPRASQPELSGPRELRAGLCLSPWRLFDPSSSSVSPPQLPSLVAGLHYRRLGSLAAGAAVTDPACQPENRPSTPLFNRLTGHLVVGSMRLTDYS